MATNYKITDIDWQDVQNLITRIYKQIINKNIKIDVIVPVLRGGIVPAMMLQPNFNNIAMSFIQVRRSVNDNKNSDFVSPKLIGQINIKEITGKNILIVEDIIDTKLTLDFLPKELEQYNPQNIFIATLYNFNKEIEKEPNFFIGKNMKEYKWIVFPWERKIENE